MVSTAGPIKAAVVSADGREEKTLDARATRTPPVNPAIREQSLALPTGCH